MNGSFELNCRCCGTTIRASYHGISGVETRSCQECGYYLEWSEEGYIISEKIPEQYKETTQPIEFD